MKKLTLCPLCTTGTMLTLFENDDGRGISECIQCRNVVTFDPCECIECGGEKWKHHPKCIEMLNTTSNSKKLNRDWVEYAKARDSIFHPNTGQSDKELLEEVAFIFLPVSSFFKLILSTIFYKIIKWPK